MTLTKLISFVFLISTTLCYSNNSLNTQREFIQNKINGSSTSSDSLLLIKAQLLSKNFQFDKAIEILKQITSQDSLNHAALIGLESLYFKTSQFHSAIYLENKLAKLNIDSSYYAIRKAISLKKTGQYKKSIDIFQQAFIKDSCNSFMTTQIGDLYKSLHKTDSAIFFYNKTCKIKASSSVIIKAMDLLLKAKQNQEALYFFKTYYKNEFAHNKLLLRLYGRTLYLNDKIDLAKETFRKLYNTGDSSLVTCKYLGMCMWKTEYYEKGIPILEDFTKRDSTDFQVYYMLGSCYVKTPFNYNPSKGEIYLDKALSMIKPKGQTLNLIYNELALLYQREQKSEKELAIYKIMKKNDPKSKYVDYKMATLYDYGFKDKKEALGRYQKLLALYQTDSTRNNKKSDIEKFCETRIEELNEAEFWE